MTAEPTGRVGWAPDTVSEPDRLMPAADSDKELVLASPFEVRSPIADIAP